MPKQFWRVRTSSSRGGVGHPKKTSNFDQAREVDYLAIHPTQDFQDLPDQREGQDGRSRQWRHSF